MRAETQDDIVHTIDFQQMLDRSLSENAALQPHRMAGVFAGVASVLRPGGLVLEGIVYCTIPMLLKTRVANTPHLFS